jgi:hypothetical protein
MMGHHHRNYRQEPAQVENIAPKQYCQASGRLVKLEPNSMCLTYSCLKQTMVGNWSCPKVIMVDVDARR